MSVEYAILAGGCFWGMQELFRKQTGVMSTRVGYTGGDVEHASYQNHGSHAEAIEIQFENTLISYHQILAYFFQIHDPSTIDRQGNDRGSSYRSAIFFLSEEQQATALNIIETIDASALWPGKVVTQVMPASDFWQAEVEHQDYLQRIPHGYTCHYPRPDWVLPH